MLAQENLQSPRVAAALQEGRACLCLEGQEVARLEAKEVLAYLPSVAQL